MWRRGRAEGGAALLPLLLIVGCAGSQPSATSPDASSGASTTLDAAFSARAEKACDPYATYNSKHFFPLKGFNRYDPDAHLLPRVGASFRRNPAYRTLTSNLEALGRPKSGVAAWSALLDDLSTGEKLMSKEISSARRANVAAFKSYDERLMENIAAMHADLSKLGLPSGSACYEARGDPLQRAPLAE